MNLPPQRTYFYKMVEGVLVCAHTLEQPQDDEWFPMVEWMKGLSCDSLDVLVVTDSAGPNVRQRKALSSLPYAKDMHLAVVTPSMLVRGMAQAISWLGIPVRAFAPTDLEAAADYLDLKGKVREEAISALLDLRAQAAGAASFLDARLRLEVEMKIARVQLMSMPLAELQKRFAKRKASHG